MFAQLINSPISVTVVIVCIAFIILQKLYSMREEFQSNLSEEASMNMADMFMFVDLSFWITCNFLNLWVYFWISSFIFRFFGIIFRFVGLIFRFF